MLAEFSHLAELILWPFIAAWYQNVGGQCTFGFPALPESVWGYDAHGIATTDVSCMVYIDWPIDTYGNTLFGSRAIFMSRLRRVIYR